MGLLGASVAERKLAWKLGDGGGQRRAGVSVGCIGGGS
jgi:hypothetical protein